MSAERWALAVLDKFLTPHERDDLREARAAIAELIEAAVPVTKGPACTREQMERLRAALVRAQETKS